MRTLIISDVDGTVNGHGLALGVDKHGQIEYRYKLYDQHIGLVNRLIKELPDVTLVFISNGVTGAEINSVVCEQYFKKPFYLCHDLEERAQTIKRLIEEHEAERVFVLSDVSDEYNLLEEDPRVVFITDEENWFVVGKYEKLKNKQNVIWLADFVNGNVLLRLLSMLKHKIPHRTFFKTIK